jgi:2-octaprenyl-6-methoxyphenol hydroxylase
MQKQFDVIIVGGGMVGACLACALAEVDLHVMRIEVAQQGVPRPPSYDDRAIALSYGSRGVFEGMGLWDSLRTHATPIRSIHVSDRGYFGFTRLHADDEGVEALGYVTNARSLGVALTERLERFPNSARVAPALLRSVRCDTEAAVVEVCDERGLVDTLSAKLLVAADGGDSVVLESLGVATKRREYHQAALATNVTPELNHRFRAFERFTQSGPLALLPMSQNRCGVVWTLAPSDARRLVSGTDAEFLAELQHWFGDRLGRFVRVGSRSLYGLHLHESSEQVRERLVVVGNAAHTLHPVAGQGFNLSLRDVAALAEVIVDASREQRDYGREQALNTYAEWRRGDQRQVARATDGLVWLFSNRFAPLAAARNLGLIAMDIVPPLKHAFARRAMGLTGHRARLERGLPL